MLNWALGIAAIVFWGGSLGWYFRHDLRAAMLDAWDRLRHP